MPYSVSLVKNVAGIGQTMELQNDVAITVDGDWAFLTSLGGGNQSFLSLYDISDRENPVFNSFFSNGHGGTQLPDMPEFQLGAIRIVGVLMYLLFAQSSSGTLALRVYDITVPTAPVFVGGDALTLPAACYDLAVRGAYAYVVTSDPDASVLKVVDVSVPAAPAVVGTLGGMPSFARSVVHDTTLDFVYVGFENGSVNALRVVDVTVPAAPADVTPVVGWPSEPRRLRAVGTKLYGATFFDTLVVYDVSTPTAASVAAVLAFPGSVSGFVYTRESRTHPLVYLSQAVAFGAPYRPLKAVYVGDPVGPVALPDASMPDFNAVGQGIMAIADHADGTHVYLGHRNGTLSVLTVLHSIVDGVDPIRAIAVTQDSFVAH